MKRNCGIDFLRMILMLMVVILHILGHGGVIGATNQLSVKYGVSWLIEGLAACAVNCYALISGYVYFSSRYKFSSLLQICLQALLYSLGIAICVWILKPEYFSVGSLINYLFPVSKSAYWYLSTYVGLFVLIPFLNAGINALSKEQTKTYLYLMFFVFSILPTIARQDTFFVNSGYSTFWLAYLYVIGACIRKYGWGDTLKPSKAFLIYICSVLISWGIKIVYESITGCLLGEPMTGADFISYTSPTMVIAAVALFLTFKNVTISPKLTGFISEFSPAAFGVYLIHEHECIRGHFISNKFVFLTEFSTPIMVVGIFSCALFIFAGCLFVDWIRHKIFARMRVNERLNKLENKYIRYNISTTKRKN